MNLGFELTGTEVNGFKALYFIKEKCPYVVLTDIVMPGMDNVGVSFFDYMRLLRYRLQ